jgi:putative ABC transport system permease protein
MPALRHVLGDLPRAALTMAVGLAALGAAYSVAYGVLLRPLPFPEGERLVMVWQTMRGWQRFPASYPIYERWAAGTTAFTGLAAVGTSEAVVTGTADAERVNVSPATANLAEVLGVQPSRGRWFTEAEDRSGEPVAVVSHEYWRTRLGADPNVIDRTLRLDDEPRRIIGVMPPDVLFPLDRTAIWTPLGPDARLRGWRSQFLSVIGRLAPGETAESAAVQAAAVTKRAVDAGESPNVGARVVRRSDDVIGNVRATLLLALAAAAAVLLIGLLNVTNVFLARGAAARREFAIRRALGAGRIRMASEMVNEGLLIGVAGAAVGLVMAQTIVGSIGAVVPTHIPRLAEVAVDGPIVLVVLAVAAVAGALLGLVAAAAAHAGGGLSSSLSPGARHSAGRGVRRFRGALVAIQVAGVFALVSGAALLLQSLDRLLGADRGFDDARLAALVEPQPPESRYPDAAARDALFARVAERLSAVPGVDGVALVAPLPFSGSRRTSGVTLPGSDAAPLTVAVTEASAGAFDVLGVRILRGRGFGPADLAPGANVGIVGESLARQIGAGGEVIGMSLLIGSGSDAIQIIGIVADVRHGALGDPPSPRVWLPYSRSPDDDVSVVVRTAREPALLVPSLRRALADVDAALVAEPLVPVTALVREASAFPRFRSLVLIILAVAGGVMAAVGIYGVTSCAVIERRRELSIRGALGARASRLVREALAPEFRIVALGLAVGVPLALLLARSLREFLHEVAATDPGIHLFSLITILTLAAIATLVPALRAARTDPAEALREE